MTDKAFKRAREIKDEINQIETIAADIAKGSRWYICIEPHPSSGATENMNHRLTQDIAMAIANSLLSHVETLNREFDSL